MPIADLPPEAPRSAIHEALITRFYTAFGQKDATAMAACYHPEVQFSDPVFVDLRGPRAAAMWKMLCVRGKDLTVDFKDVAAGETVGRAHWDAAYTFSVTGRKVLNHIDARFEFKDGLIWRHEDTFDLWTWSSMALGPVGQLLGWTPFLAGQLRSKSEEALDQFIAKES